MSSVVNITTIGTTAIVKINNPPMNVLSNSVLKALKEAFVALIANEDIMTIILSGEGERAFMGGADIKEFPARINNEPEEKLHRQNAHDVLNFIASCPKPTIAVLNGYTLGGGLELALTCDFRIAESHAVIGLPEVKLGLLPGGGGTQRLTKIVGESRAKLYMLTGRTMTAQEALQLGIVIDVVEKGSGMEAAQRLAEEMGQYSLQALTRIKALINNSNEMPLQQALVLEDRLFDEILQTEDAREGVYAFIEKRKPRFSHK